MATAVHFEALQKIYIAFYQRPADPAGMRYWASQVAEAQGDTSAVVDAFAASVEAHGLYGRISRENLDSVIDKVYQALFRREPDPQGKAFYQAAFAQETLTAGTIVLAILQGAQGDDLAAIDNKLLVAQEFTHQVDGREFDDTAFGDGWDAAYAYAGKDHALMARSMLAGVTADPATVLDAAAITRILQGVKDEGAGGTGSSAPAGSAVVSFVTGNGDDTIEVNVDGTGRNNVLVWVDAGDGDDLIRVDNTGPVRVASYAGAGDDRVVLADGAGSIGDRDVYDGGEGFDTLVMPGGPLVQGDYLALARSVTGFERVEFASRVDLDAGQLRQFAQIGFAAAVGEAEVARAWSDFDKAGLALFEASAQVLADPVLLKVLTAARDAARQALDIVIAEMEAGASHVTGVSGNQLLVAGGSLSAWADGYRAAGTTRDMAGDTATVLPGAALSVVSQGAGSSISAHGGKLKLTVMPMEAGDAATWLEGDVACADIMLAGQGDDGMPPGGMPKELASVAMNTSGHVLSALSSVTIGGTGSATIYNSDGSALIRIDASAMERVHPPDAGATDATGGLTYLSFNSKAETISLGEGVDQVTLWSSTVGSTDIVVDLNLVGLPGMPGVLDMQASDRLAAGDAAGFNTAAVAENLSLDEMLIWLATESPHVVFHSGEDTYVFADNGNAELDETDVLIRLVGRLDLDLLVSCLNGTGPW